MQWRRKKNIVYPKDQLMFALEYLYLALGFVILCAFFLFVPPFNQITGAAELADSLLPGLQELVLLQWPFVIAALIILLVVGVLLSNRLWGPIFGMRKIVAARRKGEKGGRIQLRKYDYLGPLAEDLNSLFAAEEQHATQLGDKLRQIEQLTRERGDQECEEKIKELLQMVNQGESAG